MIFLQEIKQKAEEGKSSEDASSTKEDKEEKVIALRPLNMEDMRQAKNQVIFHANSSLLLLINSYVTNSPYAYSFLVSVTSLSLLKMPLSCGHTSFSFSKKSIPEIEQF